MIRTIPSPIASFQLTSETTARGINQHNVREAVDAVQPFGLDLCSSVRTNRQLDE